MSTYVLLTKISAENGRTAKHLLELAGQVREHTRRECPDVTWKASYSLLGPYDYLDVFEAPDDLAASKVALIVRSYGHATTETWGAVPWKQFQEMLSVEEPHTSMWSKVRETVLHREHASS